MQMSQAGAETANPICCQHKQAWQVQLRLRSATGRSHLQCSNTVALIQAGRGRTKAGEMAAGALVRAPSPCVRFCLIVNYNSELWVAAPAEGVNGIFINFAYLDKLKWRVWTIFFDSQLLVFAVFFGRPTRHQSSQSCLVCSAGTPQR